MNANSANDTGLSAVNLNRRQFFAGATVAVAMNGPVAAAVPAARTAADLAEEWIAAHRKWVLAIYKPGGGNADTPECLHWYGLRDLAEEALMKAPVRDVSDVQALLRMLWIDSDAEHTESPVIPKWALEKLIEWTGAAA